MIKRQLKDNIMRFIIGELQKSIFWQNRWNWSNRQWKKRSLRTGVTPRRWSAVINYP